MFKQNLLKVGFITLIGCTSLGVVVANAQYTEIKTPTESLHELTKPGEKVIEGIQASLRQLITMRIQDPDVGAGEEEIAFFKADIQNIYNELNQDVLKFWNENKKDIQQIYADSMTPEELIVYNQYLSAPEAKSIERKRHIINEEINKLLQNWLEAKLDVHIEELTQKIIQHQLDVE